MALVNKIKGIDRSYFFQIFNNKSISNLLQVLENGSLLCPGHILRLPLFAESLAVSLFILMGVILRKGIISFVVFTYLRQSLSEIVRITIKKDGIEHSRIFYIVRPFPDSASQLTQAHFHEVDIAEVPIFVDFFSLFRARRRRGMMFSTWSRCCCRSACTVLVYLCRARRGR